MNIEDKKVGNYSFLLSESFVLSNSNLISFFISDDTDQRLKVIIQFSNEVFEDNKIKTESTDPNSITITFGSLSSKNTMSKDPIRIGNYDHDSKPLFMSFYISSVSLNSRFVSLSFYTLRHGEDIG